MGALPGARCHYLGTIPSAAQKQDGTRPGTRNYSSGATASTRLPSLLQNSDCDPQGTNESKVEAVASRPFYLIRRFISVSSDLIDE
ncbi:hypothetical protein HAX54_038002 [Datura stramonium]|uniref:Uncharacterized protein n=1 Tax=Datura stramonium TaxID=4076 RepID=A0ABS8SHJ6_DATST|nr:hypothetical protein [Datura stramonium]